MDPEKLLQARTEIVKHLIDRETSEAGSVVDKIFAMLDMIIYAAKNGTLTAEEIAILDRVF